MKKVFKLLIVLLSFICLFSFSACKRYKSLKGNITYISKYGNVMLSITKGDMDENGYEFGDVVTVKFLDQELSIPYCNNYSNVDSGDAGVFGKDDEVLTLAINTGDFATIYNIAKKTTFEDKSFEWNNDNYVISDIVFEISMKEKKGYYDEYVVHKLEYSHDRNDYPSLNDEEFANFRCVNTTNMKQNILYRSSSPIDSSWSRSTYALYAIESHGITEIIDLADTEDILTNYDGYSDSYYSTVSHVCLNMSIDYTATDFKDKLAEGIRYMISNEGVYLIHCKEGKDRTGFVIAILEFLVGASYEEAEEDYMITFYNYYGVAKGSDKYESITSSNFEKILKRAFNTDDVKNANMYDLTINYLISTGLDESEISAFRNILSVN